MGRSGGSTSCLKLIPCAGGKDSVDRDDLGVPESKGSSDRSKWSFRKKSARHRVLSNSAASEVPSENKATPDSVSTGFATQSSSATPEKSLAVQWKEEKSVHEFPVDVKVSETAETTAAAEEFARIDVAAYDSKRVDGTADDDERADGTAEEESVIIIQAAVRRFLAQRETLLRHNNIIKVQAAVRGHIVRKHAVGSLRCVQAIVKMQNLVRERQARLHGSSIKEEGKEPGFTYVSIEKLLSNAFARQLMDSTPKTKKIDMKCDPSKPDSGWNWLERWMLASSTEAAESPGLEPTAEFQAKGSTVKVDSHLETTVSSPEYFLSRDEADTKALEAPLEVDENVITYDVDKNKFHDSEPVVPSVDQSREELIGEANLVVSDVDSPIAGHTRELDIVSESEAIPIEAENKPNLPVLDTPELEGSDNEERKSSTVSRKASNPSFIAAQAKFQELGSAASLEKSASSSNREANVDSSLESDLPVDINASKTRAIDNSENSLAHNLNDVITGSECGTELSISSTLDSPDRSDAGVVDSAREARNLEMEAHSPKTDIDLEVEEKKPESKIAESNLSRIEENGDHIHKNDFDLEVEEKIRSEFTRNSEDGAHDLNNDFNSVADEQMESRILESDTADSNTNAVDLDHSSIVGNIEPVSSTVAEDASEVKQKSKPVKPAKRFSPEPSPTKSHVTVPESQGTPSSQVSVKSMKSRSGKGRSNKHLASSKESHLDSSEHQSGKRRNSFGSSKAADHSEQEPRDSSNSLPSYMQATESARAKALSLSSPRSSPDMQDKDFIKKRQSLPGASTTRQVSPHVNRAQQGAKTNGTHSPQERKWKR